jgi:hypothetical protein
MAEMPGPPASNRRERHPERIGQIGGPEPALFHLRFGLRNDAAGAVERICHGAKFAGQILGVILRRHVERRLGLTHPSRHFDPKIIAHLIRQRFAANRPKPLARRRGLANIHVDDRRALLAQPVTDTGTHAGCIDMDRVGG